MKQEELTTPPSNHVLVLCRKPLSSLAASGGGYQAARGLRKIICAHVPNPVIEFMFGPPTDLRADPQADPQAGPQGDLQAEHELWTETSDFAIKHKGLYAMVVLHTFPHLYKLGLMPIVSSLLKSSGTVLWTTATDADQAKVRTVPEQTFARIVDQFDHQYGDKWYVSFSDYQVVSPGLFVKT
jgi:hypothetical protein